MKKNIEVEESLVQLAKIFAKHNKTLYIVGGYVRNALLGFCETDIDICSSATPDEVSNILANTEFNCNLINSKLGTLHILSLDKNIEYEHTTFRAEQYDNGGMHSPNEVCFVQDIKQDASRRDFSVNALYYDILAGEILDFYDGIECIRHHLLDTVETPEYVFNRDGLRILRMARIASELDFEIDDDTFKTAQKLVSRLADISQERFNKEIVAMLFADNKYRAIANFGMQSRGVKILCELKAWQYVLTDFWNTLSIEQRQKMDTISWDLLEISPPASRISCFVIDILTALGLEPSLENIDLILGVRGVMLNKHEVAKQSKLIQAFFKIKHNTLTTDKLIRLFLQANNEWHTELFGLIKLAGIGASVIKTYDLMKLDNTPMNLRELAINGNDINEYYPEIEHKLYSQLLATLLSYCAILPEMNDREKLLDEVYNIYSRIR